MRERECVCVCLGTGLGLLTVPSFPYTRDPDLHWGVWVHVLRRPDNEPGDPQPALGGLPCRRQGTRNVARLSCGACWAGLVLWILLDRFASFLSVICRWTLIPHRRFFTSCQILLVADVLFSFPIVLAAAREIIEVAALPPTKVRAG